MTTPHPTTFPAHRNIAARLDHLVLNTHYDIDPARDLLQGLGFTVTPRGYHTLGSVNHLVMFAGGYLELIGQPRERATIRQEILDSPLGIAGLVYAVDDVPAARFTAFTSSAVSSRHCPDLSLESRSGPMAMWLGTMSRT